MQVFVSLEESCAMFKIIRDLFKCESGATAIEYGLIAALIAVAAVGAMTALGTGLSNEFNNIAGQL
jgi:pilus assembly protein Flp/PilA